MKTLLGYLGETYGANASVSARLFCNKFLYLLARAFSRAPDRSWVYSRWHWFRFPFPLRNEVMWSRALQAWFCASDESALECMLHLPGYEPVEWVAPRPGDVVLDIGAYVGWYSIWAARAVGPAGQVVALEPFAESAGQLEKNLALNRIENVRIVRKAAWSRMGLVGWQVGPYPVWNKVDTTPHGATVEAVTLDELVEALGLHRVDWIKIDVEGGEIEVLRGAQRTIQRFHPIFFVEVHKTFAAVNDFLGPLGYFLQYEYFDQPGNSHGWVMFRSCGKAPAGPGPGHMGT